MKLSVIIPVYNEEKTLAELVDKVLNVPIEKEIIIINDGSTDATGAIAAQLARENVKVFHHERNKGKAAAIRTGLNYVSGDMVIIQDGDLETDPNDYLHLVQPIIEGKAQVVYGSRNLKRANGKRIWLYDLGGRFISWWASVLYNQKITDEAACYKVFKTEIIKKIPLTYDRFEFCPEVTARVSKMGIKIHELPMSYYPRGFSEGKKMRWTDGLKAFWVLLKLRFSN
ncbi:MAG: glycosyltransferase family 2 protein [Chitinophagales bacterium]|nr:glycosyltransferase family 2 protein [Chitinophagales bacterium]MDW8274586.1 glycosyltransferase family 2 protein [Chitinophagales bacterium]